MENNKYYTPDIEDIRVGYELERLFESNWIKEICSDNYHWQTWTKQEIRTPYLCKEQIEAEGWKFEGGQLVSWGVKEFRIDINEHSWYECTLYPDVHTVIITRYDVNGDNDNQLFNGRCPSINEFRTICKLLNIK